jgi:hypothetical protein
VSNATHLTLVLGSECGSAATQLLRCCVRHPSTARASIAAALLRRSTAAVHQFAASMVEEIGALAVQQPGYPPSSLIGHACLLLGPAADCLELLTPPPSTQPPPRGTAGQLHGDGTALAHLLCQHLLPLWTPGGAVLAPAAAHSLHQHLERFARVVLAHAPSALRSSDMLCALPALLGAASWPVDAASCSPSSGACTAGERAAMALALIQAQRSAAPGAPLAPAHSLLLLLRCWATALCHLIE